MTREPLEDSELRALLDAADDAVLRDQLIIYGLAFLGVRASTMAHMTREWIDFQRERVEVPAYQQCSAGRDGGPCSECIQRLELIRADRGAVDTFADPQDRRSGRADHLRARAERFHRYANRPGLGVPVLTTALDEYDGMWFPKSGAGHRPIPVKNQQAWSVIQRWFRAHDTLMVTRQTVGNTVTHIAREANLTRSVGPHELRHTYGTRLADMEFSAYEIKDAMGHATTQQAESYVKMSGERLDDTFSEKWQNL